MPTLIDSMYPYPEYVATMIMLSLVIDDIMYQCGFANFAIEFVCTCRLNFLIKQVQPVNKHDSNRNHFSLSYSLLAQVIS